MRAGVRVSMQSFTATCRLSPATPGSKKKARPASRPGQVKENPRGSSSGRTIVRAGGLAALLDESGRWARFVAISSHLLSAARVRAAWV
jgi:hypothetical protein